jgi:hypothetical protein
MAHSWLSIRVELVGGRGVHDLWPRPGRIFAARPDMTFHDLAHSINVAFARWDRSPLHRFILPDSTMVVPIVRWDAADSAVTDMLDDVATDLTCLAPGDRFLFEFDLDDSWLYLCTVAEQTVPEVSVDGQAPTSPVAMFGWGTITDQHGRLWMSDEGEDWRIPPPPHPPLSDLPPLAPWWGPSGVGLPIQPDIDFDDDSADDEDDLIAPNKLQHGAWHPDAVKSLRRAISLGDDESLWILLLTFDAMMVAQRCAPALLRLTLISPRDPRLTDLLDSIVDRLRGRDWPGDRLLARLLRANLEGRPEMVTELRTCPVDLDTVTAVLSGPTDPLRPWALDVVTGRLLPPAPTAGADTGAAAGDTTEYLPVVGLGPELLDEDARVVFSEILMSAEEDPTSESMLLLEERQLGRARQWLAEAGLRPV